jgi:hypothetical protein
VRLRVGTLFQDTDPDAVLQQEGGHEKTHRPAPDDEYVRHLLASRPRRR